jgi:hypothetical protein
MKKLIAASATLAAATAIAQAPPPARPDPCAAPEARQFDFWLGEWEVFQPDGKPAGVNRITAIYGCVLHESWKGRGGFEGQSFNRWDAQRGVWHQTWVDSTGGILMIEGAFRDGVMTLSDATLPGKKDPKRVNEIAWSRNADGTVRQHWRVSTDGGATWTTAFDGKYVKK